LHILELPELGVLEALSFSNMYYLFSELYSILKPIKIRQWIK